MKFTFKNITIHIFKKSLLHLGVTLLHLGVTLLRCYAPSLRCC